MQIYELFDKIAEVDTRRKLFYFTLINIWFRLNISDILGTANLTWFVHANNAIANEFILH